MKRIQCFRILIDRGPNVLIQALQHFAVAGLSPTFFTARVQNDALSVTAHFVELDDIAALTLVADFLKMPRVRAATVETIHPVSIERP